MKYNERKGKERGLSPVHRIKKIVLVSSCLACLIPFSACGNTEDPTSSMQEAGSSPVVSSQKMAFIFSSGTTESSPLNQMAGEGMNRFAESTGIRVTHVETANTENLSSILETCAKDGNQVIWTIGAGAKDIVSQAAVQHPDIQYFFLDGEWDGTQPNMTGILFRDEEAAFLAGYLAGWTTQTNKVAFICGIDGTVDRALYGFRAGVRYASEEKRETIAVEIEYLDTVTDANIAKTQARSMYQDNCDVIFSVAGTANAGVEEAAAENGKWMIASEKTETSSAILASTFRNVSNIVQSLSEQAVSSQFTGGQTYSYGLQEEGVGLTEENPNVPEETMTKIASLIEQIKDETISPPFSQESYQLFLNTL